MARRALVLCAFLMASSAGLVAASPSGNADDAAAAARMRESQRRAQAALDAAHSASVVGIYHYATVHDQIAQTTAQQRYLDATLNNDRTTPSESSSGARPLRMNRYAGGAPKLFFARNAKPIVREPIKFRPTPRRLGGIADHIGGSTRSVSFDRLFSHAEGGGSFNFRGLSQGGPSFNFGFGGKR